MQAINKKAERALKKYDRTLELAEQYKDPSIPLINFSTLQQAPLHEWTVLSEGVRTKLIVNESNRLVFYVEASEDSVLINHRHDCEEHWKVIKGQLLRDSNEGVIQPYQSHKFTFLSDTTMIVEFLD